MIPNSYVIPARESNARPGEGQASVGTKSCDKGNKAKNQKGVMNNEE
jgi:hypothetical protein